MYTYKPGPWSSHTLLLAELPPQGEGRSVLDVGCGPGYLSEILSRRGYKVTGVEQPGPYCESFPAGVRLVNADLELGLPPLDEQYDYVICADVLEHLRRPGVLLAQIRETLTPGGRLIASLPNSGNVWFRLNILMGHFPQDDKGLFDRTHVRFYMWKGWTELFRGSGFAIESVQPTAIPVSLVMPPSWADSAFVRAAESVFYGMARIRKELFAYQFVVYARPQP